jgi:hypothetical protein
MKSMRNREPGIKCMNTEGNLARDSVRLTEGGAPETAADRDDGQLGGDQATANGVGDLLGALGAQADVAV